MSSTFYEAIPGYLTKAHKRAFSPVAVSEDCLARCLSAHPVCAQGLHGEHIPPLLHYTHAYIRTHTKSKIIISVSCFSGQLLGHIIDNDRQVHVSNLMNFIFIMHGNIN